MNADSEITKKLHSTMDARVWAQEWCRIAREIEASNDGREIIDEGWMIGWFANAFMMGWDEHARRYPPSPIDGSEPFFGAQGEHTDQPEPWAYEPAQNHGSGS